MLALDALAPAAEDMLTVAGALTPAADMVAAPDTLTRAPGTLVPVGK